MIKSPTRRAHHPDYGLDCEMALADEFIALAKRAEMVGWPSDTVAAAMLSLSLSHIELRKAIATEENRISEMRKKAGH